MIDIGFVPPEGVVLPKAVISLARVRHSEFWQKHLISRPEGEVWVEAMMTGNPRWLTDRAKRAYFDAHQEEGEPFTYGDDFKGRVASYHAAESEIRASLALGALAAAFFDGAGTVHQIPREVWVSDTGVGILNTGLAGVEGDTTSGTVFVIEKTFRRLFFGEDEQPEKPAQHAHPTPTAAPRAKRGRRPSHDWSAIESEALRLLDEHGGIHPLDAVLYSQTALEKLLLAWCQERFSSEPAASLLREKLPGWIAAYDSGVTRR